MSCYYLMPFGDLSPCLSASDWAGWAGSIGGLITVGLTAFFYFKDRSERRETDAKAEKERTKNREYRAWKKALMLAPTITAAIEHMEMLVAVAEGKEQIRARDKETFLCPRVERDMLDEIDMFEPRTQERLLLFFGALPMLNLVVAHHTVSSAHGFVLIPKFGQDDFAKDLKEILESGVTAQNCLRTESLAFENP